jgi:hypothetical protein
VLTQRLGGRASGHAVRFYAPRVWPGVGFGVPNDDVASLLSAVTDVVDEPAFDDLPAKPDAPAAEVWSRPRVDVDEDFVYIRGPVNVAERGYAFRPELSLRIRFEHLQELESMLGRFLVA